MIITSKRTLEAKTTEYESPRGVRGITFSVRNVGRRRGKYLHGLAIIQLSNRKFVEAPFSTGISAVNAARTAVGDNADAWLQRAQSAGVCTKKDRILHVDFVLADDSLNNDDLKEVKFEYSMGYTNVYGTTGKRGN